MGFDGVPRPSQLTPAEASPLNPYLAANAAKSELKRRPKVQQKDPDELATAVHGELPRYNEEEEETEQEGFTEEEAKQILTFARMRGIMNLALEEGVRYKFQINHETGMVDLMEQDSGKVIMTLTPSDLMQLTDKIQRYAGVLTDQAG